MFLPINGDLDCLLRFLFFFKAIHEGRQAARQIDLDLMGYSSLAGPAGIVITTKTKK